MLTAFDEIETRRILPDTSVPQHDFLFQWGDLPCFARGELVALTGKAKSGKTYVCSILMALAVRAQMMGIKRLKDKPLTVLWIDTEQSEDSTHEILCYRIGTLIEQPIPDDQYFVYNLRQDNWQERLSWAEIAMVRTQPDLVIFDGIRDVVGDINNYTEAQNVLTKLLALASMANACIVCVLHQNKALEDKTLRGALGTELQNKSYETYECQKDPDTRVFTLKQTATRKYDITAKLEFTVNRDGLPVLSEIGNRLSDNGYRQSDRGYEKYEGQVDVQAIVPKLFGNETSMRACDFKQKALRCIPEINCDTAYRVLLSKAYQSKLITKRKVSENETYYDLCPPASKEDTSQATNEAIPSLF